VEVVLDNHDQRVAVAGPHLTLKKTYHVDQDRDTYTLNGTPI
jgi:chromosome segregation ATPase